MGRNSARIRTAWGRTFGTLVCLCVFPGPGTASAAVQAAPAEYEAACSTGDHVACAVLGLLYEQGEGVVRDLDRAVDLFQRACEADEPSACASLGRMYATGSGVEPDPNRARELFGLACRRGDRWACGQLPGGEAGEARPEAFKSGRVGDAETALPLGGAVVEVPGLGLRASTDESGRFALRGLPPGRHSLRVERLGYQTLEGTFDVPGEPGLLLLLVREASEDPGEPGRIVGRVAEAGGGSLGAVEVVVDGQPGAGAVTAGSGRFALGSVTPGLVRLRFERLGYASREVELVVRPGRTSEVAVSLATRPVELAPIEVTVRSSRLERVGFYRRGRRGMGGVQFDRADIEEIRPMVLSDLLRRVPGVTTRYVGGKSQAVARRRYDRSTCTLSVRVDGVDTWDTDVDWFPPEQIEAVEIFYGLSMPIEYTSRFGACGVVMIWTRRGG